MSTIPQIDNADLPAGSPMYFYCNRCGNIAQVLHEEYDRSQIEPRKVCLMCEQAELWKFCESGKEEGYQKINVETSQLRFGDYIVVDVGCTLQPVILSVMGMVRSVQIQNEVAQIELNVEACTDGTSGLRTISLASHRRITALREVDSICAIHVHRNGANEIGNVLLEEILRSGSDKRKKRLTELLELVRAASRAEPVPRPLTAGQIVATLDKQTAEVIIAALTAVINTPKNGAYLPRKKIEALRAAMAVIQSAPGYIEACNLNWN